MTAPRYIGRFAPSPTGPLHAGSLVAAMASYLDARAHAGVWRVRIEDIDEARTVPGADRAILDCLSAFGMHWDGEVLWQSRRKDRYEAAFARLQPWIYPCACSRKEIADSILHQAPREDQAARETSPVYPGTCRNGLPPGRAARAYRLRVPTPGDPNERVCFEDRWQGRVCQSLATEVGDFVLKRADGFWAYQLAVVVDDAEQGVTDVVRGADLIDSTARQIALQRLLEYPTPRYLHVPVVTNERGEKLSKQTGAQALDPNRPLPALMAAAAALGLPFQALRGESLADFWESATTAWARRIASAPPAVSPRG